LDFAAAYAGSAGAQALAGASDHCTDTLQIYIPPALGHVVGVADLIPKLRLLAANFTYLCHLKLNSRASLDASS
jgi:hypothetical protein